MRKAVRRLLIFLLIILSLAAAYRINKIRYATVKTVWNVMDWSCNRGADKALLAEGVKAEVDISYIKDGTSEQCLDIYYPENIKDRLPVIIFTHGGGFVAGDKKQTKQYCMALAKEGYIVFNINYRLAPKSKNIEQITDVLTAMNWVKDNCEKYNGDVNRIILAGDSAGAYLTGISACMFTNEKLAVKLNFKPIFSENQIKGVLLFSGVYDLYSGSKSGFPSIKSDIEMFLGTDDIKTYKNIDDFSVIKNVTSKFPKTFISSGAADWLHSESILLIKALDDNNVYHKYVLYDKYEKKAMHDYQFRMELDISKRCMERVIEFLKVETRN